MIMSDKSQGEKYTRQPRKANCLFRRLCKIYWYAGRTGASQKTSSSSLKANPDVFAASAHQMTDKCCRTNQSIFCSSLVICWITKRQNTVFEASVVFHKCVYLSGGIGGTNVMLRQTSWDCVTSKCKEQAVIYCKMCNCDLWITK